MEVLQNIIEGIEKNKNSRKQNEWDEKYHSIQVKVIKKTSVENFPRIKK